MTLLQIVALAALVAIVKKSCELVLEHEYATWAPALARLLTRSAGVICRHRRGQWWADLLYLQRVEHRSGLVEAGWCLASAPWLAIRHFVAGRSLRRVVILYPLVASWLAPAIWYKMDNHFSLQVVLTTLLTVTISGWLGGVLSDNYGINRGAELVCRAIVRWPTYGPRVLRSRAVPWINSFTFLPIALALSQIGIRIVPSVLPLALGLNGAAVYGTLIAGGILAGLLIALLTGFQVGASTALKLLYQEAAAAKPAQTS